VRHQYSKFLLFLLLFSCGQNANRQSKQPSDTGKTFQADTLQERQTRFLSVGQVVSDTTPTYWGNFTGNYSSVLHFNLDNKDTLFIEYYGQCWYAYPIKIDSNKIVVYWDDNMDCKFDIGFKKFNTKMTRPVKGKPFMYLTLRNDTLFANYVHEDWIKEFNKKDSELTIFPDYFVARLPD
jgi:hypothetical protein